MLTLTQAASKPLNSAEVPGQHHCSLPSAVEGLTGKVSGNNSYIFTLQQSTEHAQYRERLWGTPDAHTSSPKRMGEHCRSIVGPFEPACSCKVAHYFQEGISRRTPSQELRALSLAPRYSRTATHRFGQQCAPAVDTMQRVQKSHSSCVVRW